MSTATTSPRTSTIELLGHDAIEEFLSNAYARMKMRSDTDGPVFHHRRTDTGAFALETINQSATLTFKVEPLQTIVVSRSATAPQRFLRDGDDQRYRGGDVMLSAYPDRPYTVQIEPGQIDTCVIEPALLDQLAATAPHRRPHPIRFTGFDPLSPAAAAQWWATRSYVAGLLDSPDVVPSALLVSAAANLLAAATLATFPNTALTDPTIEDRRDASSLTVRRAIAFVDAHAQDAITVADIAAAAHVSIRAIQLAFRRYLDTTPGAYLRRVRLDHAHRELVAADPDNTTVSAVAARWGFGDHSRFTATYRRIYGVLPSTTLQTR